MGQSPIEIYPSFVKRLFVNRSTDMDGLLHAAVGLSTESGECLDVVKKTWAFTKPFDTLKLTHEAGDTEPSEDGSLEARGVAIAMKPRAHPQRAPSSAGAIHDSCKSMISLQDRDHEQRRVRLVD